MSARNYTSATLFGAALLLAACSTVQENPNYQYSSKYGQADIVQTAQVEPVTPNTAPVVTVSNPAQIASPTEEAYNADAMAGTPGYAILMAEESAEAAEAEAAPAPVTAPSILPVPAPYPSAPSQTGPREIDYDYAQNVIVADVPEIAPVAGPVAPPISTQVTVPTGQTYVVQPNDTVYSLSRRLCTPIAEIMTTNGIGSDFAISIGQTLTLPSSRC